MELNSNWKLKSGDIEYGIVKRDTDITAAITAAK